MSVQFHIFYIAAVVRQAFGEDWAPGF